MVTIFSPFARRVHDARAMLSINHVLFAAAAERASITDGRSHSHAFFTQSPSSRRQYRTDQRTVRFDIKSDSCLPVVTLYLAMSSCRV
jgi:hypothetical protein